MEKEPRQRINKCGRKDLETHQYKLSGKNYLNGVEKQKRDIMNKNTIYEEVKE